MSLYAICSYCTFWHQSHRRWLIRCNGILLQNIKYIKYRHTYVHAHIYKELYRCKQRFTGITEQRGWHLLQYVQEEKQEEVYSGISKITLEVKINVKCDNTATCYMRDSPLPCNFNSWGVIASMHLTISAFWDLFIFKSQH